MAATQMVNFEVKSITKGQKLGYAGIEVVFFNSSKVYPYWRKYHEYTDKETGFKYNEVVISGCGVVFDNDFNHVKTYRKYDVHGKKVLKPVGGKKQTKSSIEEELDELIASKPSIEKPEEVIQKVIEEKVAKDSNGNVKHEKYDVIKSCLECNIPVYLAGPAGSGKNFTVEQIAWELGWSFYFSNSVQQEYKLTGFIDAGGKFHETEFFKACAEGKDCIFFLDEMDASIPEVLVLLNAAIANGYFEFPTGRVELDHVHFVAAGNTVGNGADEDYTGRMVIDQATLDRFAIIEFGYDRNIELEISGGNEELVDFIHKLRDSAEMNGIRATFSYRCITMVTKLEKAGMDLATIIKISVVKGLDKDTVKTLSVSDYSKYGNALHELKKAA